MKSWILKASVLSVAALVVLAAIGCGSSKDTPKATPTTKPVSGQVNIIGNTPTPAPTMTPAAARTGDFATLCQKSNEKQFSAPQTVIDPSKKYTATIRTEKGDIVLDLYPDVAPVTVNSFVFLACKGFYDGVTFHRVLPNIMAQGGDPLGTGRGGPGYTIPDEFSNHPFGVGTLAMANTDYPNSGGSQFFICYNLSNSYKAAWLGKYTIFGQVTSGQDVVDKITPRDPDKNPTTPGDKIVTITVQEH